LSRALRAAQVIYFMERTPARLSAAWDEACPEVAPALRELLVRGDCNIKSADSDHAINRAIALISGQEPSDDGPRATPVEELFWG
jgi:hypothetical protein